MARVRRIQGSGKPLKGAKSPGIGYLYVLVLMFVLIAAGMMLSGGFVPVDPNGPDGPPSLPPYFNASDYGNQKIILPSTVLTPGSQQDLQLKTFKVNVCGQYTGIDLLLDTSGSMTDYGKIDKEKQGLTEFVKQLAGNSVIGIQTFSSEVDDKVPLDYYKNNKSDVQNTIDNLNPNGATRTRDGMQQAEQDLADVINQNKFPGYHYALILITDGVPEILPPRTCEWHVADPLWGPAGRCFAQEQDPRVPTDVSQQIKNLGIQIYTIGIESPESSDVYMKPHLEDLLRQIASTPTSTHFYTTFNANNITQVLDSVTNSICTDVINEQLNGM